MVVLSNADGRYNTLPVPLEPGCELALRFGYLTTAGYETGESLAYTLESYEYTSSGSLAELILYASDGWGSLGRWTARQQFRWNQSGNEKCVMDILAFILARCGISLEVISSSADISNFYPDFTANPGIRGDTIVKRLISFVPDVLFMEGNRACLVHPQAGDAASYSYGSEHVVLAAGHGHKLGQFNRVLAQGQDSVALTPIMVEGANWDEVGRVGDNLVRDEDSNLGSVAPRPKHGLQPGWPRPEWRLGVGLFACRPTADSRPVMLLI